jgi:acyl carrier protein
MQEIVVENIPGGLKATDELIESGIIDSLAIQRLILFLEENFGVKIDDTELIPDNFENIQAISQMVNQRIINH